ncbi:unnamed protein product [Knipowitschia caucasica]
MRLKINKHFAIASHSTGQKAVSQPTLAPGAFQKNQNGTLCLPIISENQKIIWVHSDEINIQADKLAKLNEAFSRFPYLTRKQTISLAKSCCLLPDQVKVWFMAQRLCYGISWDSKDILEVRRKMLVSTTSKRKMPNGANGNETMKKPNLSSEDAEQKFSSNPCVIKKKTMRKSALKKREKGKVLQANSLMPWPKTETSQERSQTFCTKQHIQPFEQTDGEVFAIPDEALDSSPSVDFLAQDLSSQTPLLMKN